MLTPEQMHRGASQPTACGTAAGRGALLLGIPAAVDSARRAADFHTTPACQRVDLSGIGGCVPGQVLDMRKPHCMAVVRDLDSAKGPVLCGSAVAVPYL